MSHGQRWYCAVGVIIELLSIVNSRLAHSQCTYTISVHLGVSGPQQGRAIWHLLHGRSSLWPVQAHEMYLDHQEGLKNSGRRSSISRQ
jgi:phenylalanine-4-hydroxylase